MRSSGRVGILETMRIWKPMTTGAWVTTIETVHQPSRIRGTSQPYNSHTRYMSASTLGRRI